MEGDLDFHSGREDYDLMSCESQEEEYQTAEGSSRLDTDYETPLEPAQNVGGTHLHQFDHYSGRYLNDNSYCHLDGSGYDAPMGWPDALAGQQASNNQLQSHHSSSVPDMVEDYSTSQSNGFFSNLGWASNSGDFQNALPAQPDSGDLESQWPFAGADNDAWYYEFIQNEQHVAEELPYGPPGYGGMYMEGQRGGTFSQQLAVDDVHTTARVGSSQPWTPFTLADPCQSGFNQGHGPHEHTTRQTPNERIFHGEHSFLPRRENTKASDSSHFPVPSDLTLSTLTLRPLTADNLTHMEQSITEDAQHTLDDIPIVITAPEAPDFRDRNGRRCRRKAANPSKQSRRFLSSHDNAASDIEACSPASITPSNEPDVLLCLRDGCSKVFQGKCRRGTRQRHMRLKHGLSQGPKEYPCGECGQVYMRSDALLKHQRKEHLGLGRAAAKPRK